MREQLTLPLGRAKSARMAEIFLLSTVQFEHYWPKIEGLLDLDPSLWETFNTKESIYDKVMDGQYQVWVVCDDKAGPITTVFFTEILQFERGRDLHLFWSYGIEALRAPECVEAAVENVRPAPRLRGADVNGAEGLGARAQAARVAIRGGRA